MTDLKTALWCDLATDTERSAWLLLGRGYETGVVAKAIQNDLARAYQRLGAIMSGDHNQYQKPEKPLVEALERISTTSYIRDAHSIAIEALDHIADVRKKVCTRCGKVNPAEIHTCTPIDPLLEALRVPEKKRKWVGLTGKERRAVWIKTCTSDYLEDDYGKAIEAKLKEKNI